MELDLDQVDHLLSTTRAVRKRLDFDRVVPDEVLLRCIDLAEQAPSGSNQASRRWLIVRDPATKKELAGLYRDAGASLLVRLTEATRDNSTAQRVFASAGYLAENLERIPALVALSIYGTHEGGGKPSLFDSSIQAGWSFCLALRARGLGSAWTSLHLQRAPEVAALLGIPEAVTQVALFPVAYTTGGEFSPVARRPAHEITYHDQWGFTRANPSADGAFRVGDDPGVTVEVDIDATPERVWETISDIETPGRFAPEAAGASWVSEAPHGLGSHFKGRNASDEVGHPAIAGLLVRLVGGMAWETDCYVTEWDPPRRFAYKVGFDPVNTWATWGFDLQPLLGGGVRVGHFLRMGPNPSGTTMTVQENPDEEESIITGRLRWVRHNLAAVLAGVKEAAEAG